MRIAADGYYHKLDIFFKELYTNGPILHATIRIYNQIRAHNGRYSSTVQSVKTHMKLLQEDTICTVLKWLTAENVRKLEKFIKI